MKRDAMANAASVDWFIALAAQRQQAAAAGSPIRIGVLLTAIRTATHSRRIAELAVEYRDRGVVAAGEQSGALGQVLEKLADDLEERQDLKAKLVGAMAYPAIVSLISIFIVIFLVTYVVPQIATVFTSSKRTLPALTDANRAAIEAQNFAGGALRSAQVVESMGAVSVDVPGAITVSAHLLFDIAKTVLPFAGKELPNRAAQLLLNHMV